MMLVKIPKTIFLELKIFGDPTKISGVPLLGPGPVFENIFVYNLK